MKLLLYIILLFFLINSCSKKTAEIPQNNIDLKHVRSFTLESEEQLFGRFRERFTINVNGDYLAFSEQIKEQVYLFDRNGNFVNVIGERGRGPKEIIRISGFDFYNDNQIAIVDLSQRLMKFFSFENELIHSSVLDLDSYRLGSTSVQIKTQKEKIFLQILELDHSKNPIESRAFAVFNQNGKLDTLIGKYDPYVDNDNDYVLTHNFEIDSKNGLLFSNLQASPYIQIYDLNSYRELEYIGQPSQGFKNPSKEIHTSLSISEIEKRVQESSVSRNIYVTDSFIVQHFQILTEEWLREANYEEKGNFLVLYDKETYEFVGEVDLSHTLGAVHDNNLYFIEDFDPDNYTIGVYELVKEK